MEEFSMATTLKVQFIDRWVLKVILVLWTIRAPRTGRTDLTIPENLILLMHTILRESKTHSIHNGERKYVLTSYAIPAPLVSVSMTVSSNSSAWSIVIAMDRLSKDRTRRLQDMISFLSDGKAQRVFALGEADSSRLHR